MFSGRVKCKRAGHRSEISQIQSMSHLQRVYKAGNLGSSQIMWTMSQNLSASSSNGNLALCSQEFIPFTAKHGDTLQPRVVRDHNANSVCLEWDICGKLIERADVDGYMRRHRSSKVCRTTRDKDAKVTEKAAVQAAIRGVQSSRWSFNSVTGYVYQR